MLSSANLDQLRSVLTGFTVDTVHRVLGDEGWFALARNETTPGLRRTAGGSRIEVLTRLFSLQSSTSLTRAELVFGEVLDSLLAAGILTRDVEDVRAAVDIRPYGDENNDWWVVCDLTPGLNGEHRPMDPEHVLGISEASSSLAQLAVRRPVGSALDLGTGCGVQALHLSDHCSKVVATDVNPRALSMAKLTGKLNELDVDVRAGSLYEPVVSDTFDLIVTNPPFVISPPTTERLVYRETSLPGDEVVRQVVAGAAAHLTPGGWCQVLASWLHRRDQPWEERLHGWIEPTGLDGWVVQREKADLPQYVEMWLADAGLRGSPDYTRRYDAWLAWFEEQEIEAIGFGWINLRNSMRDQPKVRIEQWPHEVAGPFGDVVTAWAAGVGAMDAAADVLDVAWKLASDVSQRTYGPVGAEDPTSITASQARGLKRARQLDTIEAGFLSACEGELTAAQILRALASILELDESETLERYASRVGELVAEGYLLAAGPAGS